MKQLIKQALALAAVTACTVASAGVLTFDSLSPTVFGTGEVFNDGGATMTVLGVPDGFSGALLDGATPSSCDIAACPGGNASVFFAGLNAGGLNVAADYGRLMLVKSLDFGFISPLPIPGLTGFGQLVLEGVMADGSTMVVGKEFGDADGAGNFSFAHWDIDGAFAETRFASVNVFSCLYDANGDCVSDVQAQFGIDNLSYVPEPGSLALVGLSLAGLAAVRRRRQSV